MYPRVELRLKKSTGTLFWTSDPPSEPRQIEIPGEVLH
jgi:hypothetical protein